MIDNETLFALGWSNALIDAIRAVEPSINWDAFDRSINQCVGAADVECTIAGLPTPPRPDTASDISFTSE